MADGSRLGLRMRAALPPPPLLLSVAVAITAARTLHQPAVASCPPVVLAVALVKVRPLVPWCPGSDAEPAGSAGVAGRVFAMAAARNEYESFQVVVNRPNATVNSVAVAFTGGPPVGIALLSRPNSTLVHRAAYIDIKIVSDCDGTPGPWPDALIPDRDPWHGEKRNALPATAAAGHQNMLFWVDVFVHPDVPAGNYTAEVHVTLTSHSSSSSGGGGSSSSGTGGGSPAESTVVAVPFQLRVFNFTLNSTSTRYKSAYGVSIDGALMAAYGKDWHNHTSEAGMLGRKYRLPTSCLPLIALRLRFMLPLNLLLNLDLPA